MLHLQLRSIPQVTKDLKSLPGEPADIKALVLDSRTVLISWKPPQYQNGRIKKYKVEMRSLDGFGLDKDQFDIPAEQTYYTISHLEQHHRYEFWVTAYTVVGEGPPSKHVVQTPTSHVPARIASFSQNIYAVNQEDLCLPCLTVGHPKPMRMWKKNGKTVLDDSHIKINDEWMLLIRQLEITDSGNYTCSVENVFGNDEVTYAVAVQTPLAPNDVQTTLSTVSSLTLQWQPTSKHGSIIQGYYLHFKKEFGEWEKIIIPANRTSFTLNNLHCGTKYHFYLQAFNQLGRSAQTPTVTIPTQGSAPIAPSNANLIQVNFTSISLNLTSWNDGGCPITSVVIEYKLKKEVIWTLVSNNAKIEQAEFLVLDLSPETHYTLRLTAHNSAGSTVANYDFYTLSSTGAKLSPELIVHSHYGSKQFYGDLGIIVPIVAGIIMLIVTVVGLTIYHKRSQEIFCSNKYEEKTLNTGIISDLDKKSATTGCENNETGTGPAYPQEPVYLATAMSVSLEHRQDINPYATFYVPVQERMDWKVDGEDYESHGTSSNLQYNTKLSGTYESCTESMYSKIHKKPPFENETPDWIPLHNLYQSHRY